MSPSPRCTAFSSGLEVKGTTVYFKKVGHRDLGRALGSVKALLARQKKESRRRGKAWLIRLFPRNLDDPATLGGLLQSKHPAALSLDDIFHANWHQSATRKFACYPAAAAAAATLEGDAAEEAMMAAYCHQMERVNGDLWHWYRAHIPSTRWMRKLRRWMEEELLPLIHRALRLPNGRHTALDRMVTVFGSMSYGLFLCRLSDIDIGLNLRIKEGAAKQGAQRQDDPQREVLKLLTAGIRRKNRQNEERQIKDRKRKQKKRAKEEPLNWYG